MNFDGNLGIEAEPRGFTASEERVTTGRIKLHKEQFRNLNSPGNIRA
jgi:hypothetical protein